MKLNDLKMGLRESDLEVALLISDLAQAKEISKVFRKTGVIPHVYQTLESFWLGTMERCPTLCLIDVKMMNEGELLLKNHPHIKSEQLAVAFYCTDQTKPLLFSTYDIFNLGIVQKTSDYQGQIKTVLKRMNKMIKMEANVEKLQKSTSELESKLTKVMSKVEAYKESLFYNKQLKNIISHFEELKGETDFELVCEKVLGNLNMVVEFSFLSLSYSGQKLISPQLLHPKFKSIPSLWLGQTCAHGIEFFAQNMANQVTLDLIGGELVTLLIKGKRELPETIITIKVESFEFLQHFDWATLERYLSGLYTFFQYRKISDKRADDKILGPWELMSQLDYYMYGGLDVNRQKVRTEINNGLTLINIDFTELVDVITEKKGTRFYWKKFFDDYFIGLSNQLSIEFKVVSMGIRDAGLLVETDSADLLFDGLKRYVKRYPYWRYFEDIDMVLAKNIRPTFKMIPLSTWAYLNFLETRSRFGEVTSAVEDLSIDTSSQEVFWGVEPSSTV